MSKKELIIKRDQNALSKDGKQGALARKELFEGKLALLRKKTGWEQKRVVPFICTRTGKRFDVIYSRQSPEHKLQIEKIEKEQETEKDGGIFSGLASGSKSGNKVFDSSEFDSSGLYCPWCGDKSGKVYCSGCQMHVCKGRTRTLENGTQLFACHDGCGNTGELVPYGKMHGADGACKIKGSKRKTLPGRKVQGRLSALNNLRLNELRKK